MPVPDFQTWFLPLLKRLADGKDHAMPELVAQLADDLKLSPSDRSELLESGKSVYENRIGWARTYLKKAGLIESPARSLVRITARGQEALAKKLTRLDIKYLNQFPEFVTFHTYKPDSKPEKPPAEPETPLDTLERVQHEMRSQLSAELLEKIKQAPPAFFEQVVIDLLLAMGYGGSREDAGKTIGRSGDGGLDGVINEDRLGLDVVYVQAKRWENPVGRPEIQKFTGSLEGVRARKGVFLTTSGFSNEARQYVKGIEKRIVLIDGDHLASLMIQHNVGISIEAVYEIKKIDLDYFEE